MKRKSPVVGTRILDEASQLKALSSPIRLRVFEHLTQTAATAKQVAEVFGMKPTRLYHHFALLERAGLIELVETRAKRGTTEKYYKVVAPHLSLDETKLASHANDIRALRAAALQAALYDVVHGVAASNNGTVVRRLTVRTTRADADRLQRMLDEWVAACLEAEARGGRTEFSVTVAMYPTKGKRKGTK